MRNPFRKTPAPLEAERAMSWDQLASLARSASASYTWAGSSVTLDSALRSSAAWACITRLKATITSMPVDVVRVQGDRRTVLPKAQHPQLVRSPSAVVTRRQWIGQVIHALTTAGNAYADVVSFDSQGRPLQLETVNSSRVSWIDGEPYVDGRRRTRYPLGDFVHIAASHLMVDGSPTSLSPVAYGADSISTGLAAEKFGADFFRAGGMPVAVAKPSDPKQTATSTQMQEIKDAILTATQNRGVLTISGGWDLSPFNINPDDTQFLDLLQHTILDAARRWLVPPQMIFAAMTGQNVTYASVSDADLNYWKHGLISWTVDLEDFWSDAIPGSLVARFNVDSILRMDKKARSEEHRLRLETKTRTVNEVRRLEDEEPFDDPIYDEPGIPEPTAPTAAPPTDQGGGV